jgi:glycine/D-amino acid oxidase-like deaminating enzyme
VLSWAEFNLAATWGQEIIMQTIVIGAGIVGVLCAYRLAKAGAGVTLVEAGQPAQGASGASFGWINASFYADDDHFRLRVAAMAAHRRLAEDIGTRAIQWPGCLCWEETGSDFDQQRDALAQKGYDLREVSRDEFRRLEPQVAAPERALLFAGEGVVDLVALCRDALAAACRFGARTVAGVRVTGIETAQGRVAGVRTDCGLMSADRVLVAGGVASADLLDGLGIALPMLRRPGLILKTAPMAPCIRHVLVSPGQELRQDSDGCLLAPTAAQHQKDNAASIDENPVVLADRAAARVSALIGRTINWQQVTLAQRPVPGDGLPVIGPCGPTGLYVATMHSGATLAPLVAELAAQEMSGQALGNMKAALLAPYRPQRFA